MHFALPCFYPHLIPGTKMLPVLPGAIPSLLCQGTKSCMWLPVADSISPGLTIASFTFVHLTCPLLACTYIVPQRHLFHVSIFY